MRVGMFERDPRLPELSSTKVCRVRLLARRPATDRGLIEVLQTIFHSEPIYSHYLQHGAQYPVFWIPKELLSACFSPRLFFVATAWVHFRFRLSRLFCVHLV